jgi:DNA mismatch endonuclease Vsr
MLPDSTGRRHIKRPDFTDVSDARRRNLAAVGAKNTKPELVVRNLLHAMGYRYRLHSDRLPGRPDIVFPARRKVIDIRGCFWHRHSDPNCRNAVLPKTRADWWAAKLARNVERDEDNEKNWGAQGWSAAVVWECEVRDTAALGERLQIFLGPPGKTGAR